MLKIQDTEQYNQMNAFFGQGISELQAQLLNIETGKTWSLSSLSSTSTVLMNVSKQLREFLCTVSSLPLIWRPANITRDVPMESIWITAAISNLRVLCHEYSLIMTRIAAGIEQRRQKYRKIPNAKDWKDACAPKLTESIAVGKLSPSDSSKNQPTEFASNSPPTAWIEGRGDIKIDSKMATTVKSRSLCEGT